MATKRATRIFAAAGHTKQRNGTQLRGGLFFTSPDDGQWQALSAGLPENVEARAFAVHPGDPDVIYVGTQDGPYRSTDGGRKWERLGFPDRGAVVWSLTFHPTRPQVMYAGTAPVVMYRSENGGDTWSKLPGARSPEHCPMNFPTRVTGIAVDAGRPDDVYAALEVSGVIASRDGGETWADLSEPLIRLSDQPHLKSRLSSNTDTSGMIDSHAIAVNKAGTAFFACRMGLFRSDDRGASWSDMEVGRFSPLTYCRDVIVSPHDERVMYACLWVSSRGNDGSLCRSDDAGETWRRFDHDLKSRATMMGVAGHPGDPARVYCVSRCGQVFGTEDTGATWREYQLPEGVQDVYSIACA